jgi:hypothetical protein
MEWYCIGFLIIAWILSLFGFDDYFVQGFNELFGKTISVSGYYMIFFLVGAAADLIHLFKSK